MYNGNLHQIQLLFCNSEFTMHKQILQVLTNKLEYLQLCSKNKGHSCKCSKVFVLINIQQGNHTIVSKAKALRATQVHPGVNKRIVQ